MSLHKVDAGRYVRIAQVAAIVLVGAAGLIWAVSIPGVNERYPDPAPPDPTPSPATAQAPETRRAPLNRETADSIAIALEGAASVKKPETEVKGPEAPPAPAPAATGEWKYLGPIFDGVTVRALVTIPGKDGAAGRQRIVRNGFTTEDKTTVAAIDPEVLTLRDSAGVERQVRRLTDGVGAVSWVRPGGGAVAGGTARLPGAGGPGGSTLPGAMGAANGAHGANVALGANGQRLPSATRAASLTSGGAAARAGESRTRADAEAAALGSLTSDADAIVRDKTAASEKLDTDRAAPAATGEEWTGELPEIPDDLREMQVKLIEEHNAGGMSIEDLIRHLNHEYTTHGIKFDPSMVPLIIKSGGGR